MSDMIGGFYLSLLKAFFCLFVCLFQKLRPTLKQSNLTSRNTCEQRGGPIKTRNKIMKAVLTTKEVFKGTVSLIFSVPLISVKTYLYGWKC